MSANIRELNSHANVFIFVNLGCEMLYVIDQRLKAQNIELHKSIQVMQEVTSVFLDEKFIESLIVGSAHTNGKILSQELCKFMLNDIAQSSIMRLETNSMDKLWNIMATIYKWQLFHTKHRHHLLDITFRHLDGILALNSNENLCKTVDCVKNKILEFWNSLTDDVHLAIYCTNKLWLEDITTKISLLIRHGFQAIDGSFISDVKNSDESDFLNRLGDNIYIKAAKLDNERRQMSVENQNIATVHHISDFVEFLQRDSVPLATNLPQCNVIFNDIVKPVATSSDMGEFVQLGASNVNEKH